MTTQAILLLVCLATDAPPATIPGAEQWDVRSKDGLDYRVFVSGPAGKPRRRVGP